MPRIILLIFIFFAAFVIWQMTSDKTNLSVNEPTDQTVQKNQSDIEESEAIFIPYWNVPNNLANEPYDRFFYFGITADSDGVDRDEEGYSNLSSFVSAAAGREMYLTLRLLDTDKNLSLLKNESARRRVIQETLEVARQHEFNGLILDLELSALPFSNVKSQINDFIGEFYTESQATNQKFLVAIYGDVFYRNRPFDMNFIGEHSDEILVMAYDFHKSYGEPGPNFPLNGKNIYGYDLKHMASDFIRYVPPEKLTIIYGMYGYDWIVDAKKRPIKRAKALSYLDIKADFIDGCEWQNCLVLPDAVSAETEINYVDSSTPEFATNHIIWFEDKRSMNLKKTYLKEQGVHKSAIWVYGYF